MKAIRNVSFLVAIVQPSAIPAQEAAKMQKTAVLVHGAFADGSSWDKIFAKAFDDKVTSAAGKSKPSWFIVAENDRDDPARKQPCFRVLGQDRGSAHLEGELHTF